MCLFNSLHRWIVVHLLSFRDSGAVYLLFHSLPKPSSFLFLLVRSPGSLQPASKLNNRTFGGCGSKRGERDRTAPAQCQKVPKTSRFSLCHLQADGLTEMRTRDAGVLTGVVVGICELFVLHKSKLKSWHLYMGYWHLNCFRVRSMKKSRR